MLKGGWGGLENNNETHTEKKKKRFMRENKKRAIPGLYTSIAVQVGVGSRGIQITTQLEKKVTQSASLRLSASQKEEEKGAV